jgi:hypothetical protein
MNVARRRVHQWQVLMLSTEQTFVAKVACIEVPMGPTPPL